MDSNKSIEKILPEVYSIISSKGSLIDIEKIPRKDREDIDISIIRSLQEMFDISQNADVIISSIVLTYLSLTYNDDLFQPYPFSIRTMQSIASILR